MLVLWCDAPAEPQVEWLPRAEQLVAGGCAWVCCGGSQAAAWELLFDLACCNDAAPERVERHVVTTAQPTESVDDVAAFASSIFLDSVVDGSPEQLFPRILVWLPAPSPGLEAELLASLGRHMREADSWAES